MRGCLHFSRFCRLFVKTNKWPLKGSSLMTSRAIAVKSSKDFLMSHGATAKNTRVLVLEQAWIAKV